MGNLCGRGNIVRPGRVSWGPRSQFLWIVLFRRDPAVSIAGRVGLRLKRWQTFGRGAPFSPLSRPWINCRPDSRRRSRVRSTRENRRFSKGKKVRDDFFNGQLAERRCCGLSSGAWRGRKRTGVGGQID